MKIVCDNCATKYQIADEKVSGKAFKIRCKKCGHVIVVNKGAGDAGAGPAGGADGAAPPDAAAPAAESAAPSDAVWHLVIDREQVGPMTADEVRGKVKAGQVDADTYGWKEGFDDWKKLSDIDDFKDSFAGKPAPDDQATRRTEPADLQRPVADAGPAPGSDLFGGGAEVPMAAAPSRTASPQAATMMGDSSSDGGYAASHGGGGGGGELASLAADGGGGRGMTGARSENSVLFSLNNLSALAGGGGGGGGSSAKAGNAMPSVQSEASGLIDIRAMAAATLGTNQGGGSMGMNKGPDLFGGGDVAPVFTPVAPPVLVPSADQGGMPKWVFGLIGAGGLIIVGLIGFLIWYVNQPPPGTVVAQGGPVTGVGAGPGPTGTIAAKDNSTAGATAGTGNTGAGTNPAAGTSNTGAGTTPGTKPPATGDTSAKSADKGKDSGSKSKDSGSKSKDSGSKSKDSGKDSTPKAGKEPEVAPPPPPPKPADKPKPNKPKDDLDSLLDSASSGSGGKPTGGGAAKKDLPEQLSMDQIKSGLKGASLGPCKEKGAAGVYNVKLTIGKNGKISSASASGGAAADCVESAVKATKFPEFSGDPMSLTYPVIVR